MKYEKPPTGQIYVDPENKNRFLSHASPVYSATLIAQSVPDLAEWNDDVEVPLSTVLVTYPRFVHAELMTHRALSRNASSSRAIPVLRMLKSIWSQPATPIHWGRNESGMQANEELTGWRLWAAKRIWSMAMRSAIFFSYLMHKVGGHKQIVNRIAEPWQTIKVLITATDWENFFNLRIHKDAQPEIRELAMLIQRAIDSGAGTIQRKLKPGEWHTPFVDFWPTEEGYGMPIEDVLKVSVARCARGSYTGFEGENLSFEKEVALHYKLVGADPIHASPTEHPAQCLPKAVRSRNFVGWYQYRNVVEERR